MTKVLVIDDDPSTVTVVRYHLENAGFDGYYADDAEEGWRLLVTEVPDVVVVDIKLPGEDGWSFLKKMRGDGRFTSVPAVVLSGTAQDGADEQARGLGAEYLSKPFAATALLTRIRGLAEDTESGAELSSDSAPNRRVEMVVVSVVLLLDAYRIEGKLHLPPELVRFSDAWESVMRDHREYVPVTDALVTTISGVEVVASPFLEVRKSDVRAVFPLDLAP
jgi:two-component system, OmpR family, alkaline phosphatase synthesis response regulator PhoP